MKEIEIVFTKSKKSFALGSWLIRLWTWKPYSHVARKIQIGFLDKSCYWQANEGKINWDYEDFFLKKHEIVLSKKFEVTEEEYKEFNKLCWEQVGSPYGTLQNLGIALVDIAKIFGFKIDNPWKTGDNCSEALYRVILKKRHQELQYDPNTIKPHHIEKILVDYYG